jgi:UDP-glucuronate decarboxylase|tara:strand:+ start:2082 stop:3032 length:951 start_codon:yes stop_codon:yes gene_type:complete
MMKLLLTGGTGFFGRALLRKLSYDAAAGNSVPEVVVLSRYPKNFIASYPEFENQHWLKLSEGNILDSCTLPKNSDFSHILHAATESTNGPNLTPLQRYDEIVSGTRNILEYAVSNKIPKLLLTSSGGVYGPQPKDMDKIPESYLGSPDPLDPVNAYSLGKRSAEHLCSLFSEKHGIEIVIARCFAFVGHDLPKDAHFAIGNFISDALHKDFISVTGDGSQIRSYLNQKDLAIWLMILLEKGKEGLVYNVGSDESISILELAYLVRDTLSPGKSVIFQKEKNAHQGRNIYVPDITKAKHDLNLKVSISLQESLAEFL